VSATTAEELQEDANAINSIKKEELERFISVFDLKRLESYSKNLVDFHLIMDLVPTLAKLYFTNAPILPRSAVSLSYTQSAILLGLGLQFKTVDDLQSDLNLQANQLLPLFNKGIRKFTRVFREVFERHIAQQIDAETTLTVAKVPSSGSGVKQSLHDELREGETALTKKMKEERAEFIKKFQKHQIKSTDEAFQKELHNMDSLPSVISVAKQKRDNDDEVDELQEMLAKKNKHGAGETKRVRKD
jgi:N-acetyltransferase 10